MFHNPAHVDTILDFAERQWEADVREKGSDKIGEYLFFKGCREIPRLNLNITESVLRFVKEFPNENPLDKTVAGAKLSLISVQNNELTDYDNFYITAYSLLYCPPS